MEQHQLKRSFWNDSAQAGLIMGVLIAAFDIIIYLLGMQELYPSLKFTYYMVVIATVLIIYGRKHAELYGRDGFTYGQSIGFMAVTGLFAGFIVGVGMFIMIRYVAPEYYREVMEQTVTKFRPDMSPAEREEGLAMAFKVMKNPMMSLIAGMINMLIYSLFVGLIAAVFVKREPNIFN